MPVFNENVPQVVRYRDDISRRRAAAAAPVSIPALTPVVASVVDRPHFSFVAYASKTTDTTSRALSVDAAACSSRFRELEVRLLLGEIAPQLRHSA